MRATAWAPLPLLALVLALPPLLLATAHAHASVAEGVAAGWSARGGRGKQDAGAPAPAPAPAVTPVTPVTTARPITPPPCVCGGGQCGCCTGYVMQSLGFAPLVRGCINVTYDPDEFSFKVAVNVNGRELYTRTVSGKNPRPLCARVPRIPEARICWRLYNVYFIGPNLHACTAAHVSWRGFVLWEASFNCFRIGANGVATLTPEDGGGLPQLGGAGGGGGGGGSDYDEYDDPEDEDDDDDDDDDDDGEIFRLVPLFLGKSELPVTLKNNTG